jgi:hypothetical protein
MRDGDGSPPCFSCNLTPWCWIPGIPVNTAHLPIKLLLAQSPCPEPAGQRTASAFEGEVKVSIDPYDISARNEEAMLAGTERWCATKFSAKGRARGRWVEMHTGQGNRKEVVHEGKWWSKGLRPCGVGGWIEYGSIEVKKPLGWKL